MTQLGAFIELGRDIIAFDRTRAFGGDHRHVSLSPGTSRAQPGFMGHTFSGTVIVGQNPGEGNFGTWAKDNRELDGLLGAWHEQGTLQAYDAAFSFFRRTFANSPGWHDWVAPILLAGNISLEHIAVLNLVKVPTRQNRKPTSVMYREDWQWTKKQLDLLTPTVVVAGGVEVHRQITRRYADPPFALHLQNRARAIPGLSFVELERQRRLEPAAIGTAIKARTTSL